MLVRFYEPGCTILCWKVQESFPFSIFLFFLIHFSEKKKLVKIMHLILFCWECIGKRLWFLFEMGNPHVDFMRWLIILRVFSSVNVNVKEYSTW